MKNVCKNKYHRFCSVGKQQYVKLPLLNNLKCKITHSV